MKNRLFAFFLFSFCNIMTLAATDKYVVKTIDIVANEGSMATDINSEGKICGIVRIEQTHSFDVFVWDPQRGSKTLNVQPLTLPILNKKGQVAATVLNKGWFYNSIQGVIWEEQAGFRYFNNPIWKTCYVKGFTDNGELLVADQSSKKSKTNPNEETAIIIEDKTLSLLFSTLGRADRINNHFQVLGTTFIQNDQNEKASPVIVNIKTGSIQLIPFEDQAIGYDINDLGQVAGRFYNSSTQQWNGFLWSPTESIVLEAFFPVAINNMGQMVGYDLQGRSCLYEEGQVKKLSLAGISAINDQGTIVGWKQIEGKVNACMLIPADDSDTVLDQELANDEKPLSSVIILDSSNFHMTIQRGIYLVDFYAEWCGHCKKMAPVLDALAEDMQGRLNIAKLDAELYSDISKANSIGGYPTLILFKNGIEINRFPGYRKLEAIKQMLEEELKDLPLYDPRPFSLTND